MSIKITVGGCRDFNDSEYIFKCLDEYIRELCDEEIIIISGHCSGVDAIAEKYAEVKGFETVIFPAEWDKYGRAAGPARNKKWSKLPILLSLFGTTNRAEQNHLSILQKNRTKLLRYIKYKKAELSLCFLCFYLLNEAFCCVHFDARCQIE